LPEYPVMKSREVLRLLARDGWVVRRQSGSHVILSRPDGTGRIVVPAHPGDIPPGTVRGIFSQAGLTPDDVRRLRS